MPKRISIIPHLSIDQLEQCYRQTTNGIERSHDQIIWLLAQGRPTKEVAAVTGYRSLITFTGEKREILDL